MFDAHIRPIIDPPLNYMGRLMAFFGISANALTSVGFFFGLSAMGAIVFRAYDVGIFFFGLNRFFDGLDGAVTRHNGHTDTGGFLDIVCDFIIYSGMVFAFCLSCPEDALYGAFLIFSFIGPITSFLAYAIIAAKKNVTTTKRGIKSFYYLGGICEGTETTAVLLIMCFFPTYFKELCLFYGVLCWMTTLGRTYRAFVDFDESAYIKSAKETPLQGP